MMKIMI